MLLMKIRIRIFFNIKYTYIVVRKEGIIGNLSKNSCKYVTRQDYLFFIVRWSTISIIAISSEILIQYPEDIFVQNLIWILISRFLLILLSFARMIYHY